MGLDSVELVMEMEKYFGIRIMDAEAEKMYTVQDAVDTIAHYLKIGSIDTPLRDMIFARISLRIQQMANITREIQLSEKASDYLPLGDNDRWNKLERLLELKVPRPDKYDSKRQGFSDIFKELTGITPTYDWQMIPFDRFTDAICACNYKTLVDPQYLKSKHEIYIAVAGITADRMGIDNYEILPGKSFTTDLGIN